MDTSRPMESHDLGELPDGYYVPITGELGVRDMYAGDFRSQFINPPKLETTGYYAEYPFPELDHNCQLILHTNILAAPDCPLPHECGPTTSTVIDAKWWGDEHVLCSSAGAHHHIVSPSEIPTHPGWGLVFNVLVDVNDDLCDGASLFNVLLFPNGTQLVVTRNSLSNRPLYHLGANKYEVPFLQLDQRLGTDTRCMVRPYLGPSEPYRSWRPPFLARRRRGAYTGIQFTPLDDVNLTTVIIRGDWGDDLRPIRFHSAPDEPLECLNIKYVTKFGVPGSSIIPVALDQLLDFTVKVLDAIVEGFIPFFTRVYSNLDVQYRITEVTAVLLLSLWWTNRAQHAAVVTVVYTLITGLRR